MPQMLTCIPVNIPHAHPDTALGKRNSFQALLSADSRSYGVRQPKKGLLFLSCMRVTVNRNKKEQ